MSEQVVPSWEGVRETWWARVRRVDQKLVIAVLIGIVSVTGAFITFRSSKLGENATDKDRQAIAETVQVEQANADTEAAVQSAQQQFAQFKQNMVNAAKLDEEADSLEKSGFASQASGMRDEADSEREVASTLRDLGNFGAYVVNDDTTQLPDHLDVDRLRQDSRHRETETARLNPDATVQQAKDFRNRSQRLEGWTILLVVAVVLLTVATITNRVAWRPWLTGIALVIFVGATAFALVGD